MMQDDLNETEQAAFEQANLGIRLGAEARHAEALAAWRAAADVVGAGGAVREDLAQWIRTGYGAALYDAGAYEEAIGVALETLQWSEDRQSVLSLLTIARAELALGRADAAKPYLRSIHSHIGAEIFEQFEEGRHAVIQAAIAGG